MIKTKCFLLTAAFGFSLIAAATAYGAGGCSTAECHEGIANIKPDDHEMMRTIKMNGSQHGDPDGCVMVVIRKQSKKKKPTWGYRLPFVLLQVPRISILTRDRYGLQITHAAPAIPDMSIAQPLD